MKTAEIFLPYFKQGDDLRMCLDQDGTCLDALDGHVELLVAAADILRGVKEVIRDRYLEVEFFADCHMIQITGPDGLVDELVKKELASYFDDDEGVDPDALS